MTRTVRSPAGQNPPFFFWREYGAVEGDEQEGRHGHMLSPRNPSWTPTFPYSFHAPEPLLAEPRLRRLLTRTPTSRGTLEQVNAIREKCLAMPSHTPNALVASHSCTHDMKRAGQADLSPLTHDGPPLTLVAPTCAVSRDSFSSCSASFIPPRGAIWQRPS